MWLKLRGIADKVVAPHQSHRLESWSANRRYAGVDSGKGRVHGCPSVREDGQRFPPSDMRDEERYEGVHMVGGEWCLRRKDIRSVHAKRRKEGEFNVVALVNMRRTQPPQSSIQDL